MGVALRRGQRGEGGGARGQLIPPGRIRLPSQVGRQCFLDQNQMLLPLPYEVVQTALADEQRGRGADQLAVEQQLGGAQAGREQRAYHPLPALQVVLQLPGVLPLGQQLGALLEEGGLDAGGLTELQEEGGAGGRQSFRRREARGGDRRTDSPSPPGPPVCPPGGAGRPPSGPGGPTTTAAG